MTAIRVLVVDDSVVVRKIVQHALEGETDVEVVGTASDGRQGVEQVERLDPDIVTLDIEMPVMDGVAALVAIRKRKPRLPVIMFSTLTQRAAAATLDALAKGASDYVTKPSNLQGMDDAVAHVRAELIPRIRALVPRPGGAAPVTERLPGLTVTTSRPPPAGRVDDRPARPGTAGPGGTAAPAARRTSRPADPDRAARANRPANGAAAAPAPRPRPRPAAAPAPVPAARGTRSRVRRRAAIDAVLIGVSTGGPNALNEVIPALPADLGVPVLIVQHMPPLFTKILAERLDSRAALDVHEAVDGDLVTAGGVWLAPGGHHMVVRRDTLGVHVAINDDPPENSCRPAVDPLFRTATDAYEGKVLAVILTGMGHDGMHGCEHVAGAGGQILAQDEATSVVWGMPGYVARAGLAEAVLPIGDMAGAIAGRVGSGAARAALGRPGP
jgi:two-component system chemotaxis response regulator CheB